MSAVLRRSPGCKRRPAAFIPDAMRNALGSRAIREYGDDSRLVSTAYAEAGARGLAGDARTIAALETVQQHYLDVAGRLRKTARDRFDFEMVESAMSRSYDMRGALRRLREGQPA